MPDLQKVAEGRVDKLSRSDKLRIFFDIPEVHRFRIDLRQCLSLLKGDHFPRHQQLKGDDMTFTLSLKTAWALIANLGKKNAERLVRRF